MGLNDFYLSGFYPTDFSVGEAYLAPLLHGIVGDGDLRSLVEDEEVSARGRRDALHRHCRLNDNGPVTMVERLLLLPGEEVGKQEEEQRKQSTEETYLTQPYGR